MQKYKYKVINTIYQNGGLPGGNLEGSGGNYLTQNRPKYSRKPPTINVQPRKTPQLQKYILLIQWHCQCSNKMADLPGGNLVGSKTNQNIPEIPTNNVQPR